jgi:hypothetical protein
VTRIYLQAKCDDVCNASEAVKKSTGPVILSDSEGSRHFVFKEMQGCFAQHDRPEFIHTSSVSGA